MLNYINDNFNLRKDDPLTWWSAFNFAMWTYIAVRAWTEVSGVSTLYAAIILTVFVIFMTLQRLDQTPIRRALRSQDELFDALWEDVREHGVVPNNLMQALFAQTEHLVEEEAR